MSLTFYEHKKLMSIPEKQESQIEKLKMAIERQDRQIALLERIVAALESRQDDGR